MREVNAWDEYGARHGRWEEKNIAAWHRIACISCTMTSATIHEINCWQDHQHDTSSYQAHVHNSVHNPHICCQLVKTENHCFYMWWRGTILFTTPSLVLLLLGLSLLYHLHISHSFSRTSSLEYECATGLSSRKGRHVLKDGWVWRWVIAWFAYSHFMGWMHHPTLMKALRLHVHFHLCARDHLQRWKFHQLCWGLFVSDCVLVMCWDLQERHPQEIRIECPIPAQSQSSAPLPFEFSI